jgi:hypothetical protein
VSEHPRGGRSYIPEAAWRAFSETEPEWKFTDKYDRHAQLEAAAPHIARAAQVAILREMEEQLKDSYNTTKIVAYFEAGEQCRLKRVGIERGEGEK